MSQQVLENKHEILKIWDNEAQLSRARFELKLAQILGESGVFMGKAGA